MVSKFYMKYFLNKEHHDSNLAIQYLPKALESLVDFVRQLKDLALECYDERDEKLFVEICVNNIEL